MSLKFRTDALFSHISHIFSICQSHTKYRQQWNFTTELINVKHLFWLIIYFIWMCCAAPSLSVLTLVMFVRCFEYYSSFFVQELKLSLGCFFLRLCLFVFLLKVFSSRFILDIQQMIKTLTLFGRALSSSILAASSVFSILWGENTH